MKFNSNGEPCFKSTFPKTIQFFDTLCLLFEKSNREYSKFVHNKSKLLKGYSIFHDEVIAIIGEDWLTLESYSDKHIAEHIYKVIFLSYLEFSSNINEKNHNLILWSCLLHDVKKLGFPVINGKDPFHPFKSGVFCIQFCIKIGLINDNKTKILEICEEILKCHISPPHFPKNVLVQDHAKACPFFDELNNLISNQFSLDLFKIVTFHQSCKVCEEFDELNYLDDDKLVQYFNIRLLDSYEMVRICDSNSYELFHASTIGRGLARRNEIREKINYYRSKRRELEMLGIENLTKQK